MGRTGISLLWLCLCCTVPASFSQLVNVATGKTYSQSSFYEYLPSSPRHPSSYAANGKTSGAYELPNCIHTSSSDYTPWWQVDLGRKYPVSDITLWARTGYIDRLYALNITVDGQLCVRATNNNKRNQSVSCSTPIYGQVVKLTRENRKTGNDISLNLCEVQIWSCNDGYMSGSTCVQCSSNCVSTSCHPLTGKCTQGCKNGYYSWGSTCIRCSSNCKNDQCDPASGRCTQGCDVGWYGERCYSECSSKTSRCTQCVQDGGQCTVCSGNFKPPQCTGCKNGYYSWGSTCIWCNSNCKNDQCDPASGRCTQGCDVGWYGEKCYSGCSSKTSRCTQCAQDGGQCTECSGNFNPPQCTGCKTGYYGDGCSNGCNTITEQCSLCTQDGNCTACNGNLQYPGCRDCIDGFYKRGNSCTKCTWKCDKDAPCNKTTGHCAECPAGKKGDRCQQDCDNNHYGPSRCSLHCGQCKDSTQCDPVTGHCQQCEPGWSLPLCKESCTGKTYGENCNQSCGQCKGGQACDPLTGECTVGCGPGFKSSDVFCKTKCDVGMRGENCSIPCGHCQYVTTCNHVTGECGASGCSYGFSGALCLQETEEKESLVGPVVGSVLGAGLLIGISVIAGIWCWRRKSNGGPGKPAAVEMSSSAPVNNLSDSATTGAEPPPPASSTEVGIYEIEDNDNDTYNSRLRQAAPPSSLSAARTEGKVYENEIEENNYDKLSPYSNDDGDRDLYTELADVTNYPDTPLR